MTTTNESPILEATALAKTFRVKKRNGLGSATLRAVANLNLAIKPGEAVGLLGESGSGKTTIGRMMMRLTPADSGTLVFEGQDITRARASTLRRKFRRTIAMVFQNPGTSLSPHLRVGEILAEPLKIHRMGNKKARARMVRDAILSVGLPEDVIDRYSSELSGGQRQRVGIARALMLDPSLIVADEPTASLDVSVQAQILNLMKDLQKSRGLSYLFITHDLAVAHYFCDRIVVLYLGEVVEMGPSEILSGSPQHPYTTILRSTNHGSAGTAKMVGQPASALDPPSGCVFRTRCPIARSVCAEVKPPLRDVNGSTVACHFPGELAMETGVDASSDAPSAPAEPAGQAES